MEPQLLSSCWLHTRTGDHQLRIELANNFARRLRGLMLTPGLAVDEGLLLTGCKSVHTAFMCYSIDVLYLDQYGRVTRCVPNVRPWRASACLLQLKEPSAHTLEMGAGAIERYNVQPGDLVSHPLWVAARPERTLRPKANPQQSGSAMVEFVVVAPIITLLGLSVVQYGMMFFAKNQVNYASFMAAREGATGHASLTAVHAAYVQALVPMYGGGQTPADLAKSLAKANADLGAGNVSIELLNPTRESFVDWNDPALQVALGTGSKRVIPNAGQAFKSTQVGAASGQTIQDANLIKLRITHGYEPKVPLVNRLYTTYLGWLDPKTNAFHSKMVAAGRVPLVTQVTLQMQSDAIEPGSPVSTPGPGNGGNPTNPGDPPISTLPPPDCIGLTCEHPEVPPPSLPCDPLTDPFRCAGQCVPTAEMCCLPPTRP